MFSKMGKILYTRLYHHYTQTLRTHQTENYGQE